ncbi:MAG: hypothetical protein OEX18_15760 [Candidatus Krumholzibacteria bacterium]|jgi:hypothetical protein|nr:hypothetical protein [Candidatus Krumholzibacteria bacterium]MDH5268881.1 hypothetical protein [Candidatus Krumholzibacteria bacterium]
MTVRVRVLLLRTSGILLCALGVLHLAVTPFIAQMLTDAARPAALDWLRPPMLLNHIVVGVLLLPLGVLITYAAPHSTSWARVTTRVVASAIATLPPTLVWVMGTHYFGALPFQLATAIVCVGSVTLLAAAFWPSASGDLRE